MTTDPSRRAMVSRASGLAALSVLWWLAVLAVVALFGTGAILWMLVLSVPPGLVVLWSVQRDVSAQVDALQAEVRRQGKTSAPSPAEALEARLADLAATAARTEARLAMFTSTRARPASARSSADAVPSPGGERAARTVKTAGGKAPPASARNATKAAPKLTITGVTPVYAEQRQLALGPVESAPQEMPVAEIVKALNFPEDERDTAGFDALRRALKDPGVGRLIKASQDVLTLLSQDGIYMDDLPPDRAKPAVWRRFAQGERSRAMAELGGVRDRSSLALSAGRMREDVIFRDAAHHFLRLFDRTLMALEPRATDAELVALTDTRTARAFMLLGRVAGTFD